jgi:hypothetical protein
MHNNTSVSIKNSVLSSDRYQSLIKEISESNLDFTQQYPNRLFSDRKHQSWLLDYFQPLIDEIENDTGYALSIQQIFLGYELPGAQFMFHRSHPAIAGVVVYSIDDFDDCKLTFLTDSQDAVDDYLWGQGNYTGVEFEFKANQALVVMNEEQRRHWGFGRPEIQANRLKRSVWIYFGK